MDRYQKEVLKSRLTDEKAFLQDLTKSYQQASDKISMNIASLLGRSDANLQHVVYQVQYQKALKQQIDGVLDNLRKSDYNSISDYLRQSYEEGFVGSMYNLQMQGVPLAFPLNQDQVVKALQIDSKIKGGMYKRLGVNAKDLKSAIRAEVSRGISTGSSYADIARIIDQKISGTGLYNSMRIARTEGHRVAEEAKMDAMLKCKNTGADVVKKWDSTLDGKTRPSHRNVDGQVRELDEPFSNGLQFPSDPQGEAKEVINCRCTMLEVGRWELDEDDVNTKFLNENEGKIISFKDSASYEDFKKQYWSKVPKAPVEKKVKVTPPPVVEDKLFPAVLAGVKRGSMMNFDQANELRANPNYSKGGGYQINCQSCVVGYEARRRGYNVETLPNIKGSMLEKLSRNSSLAWIDPVTGKHPTYIYDESALTAKKFQSFMESQIEKDKRYTLQFAWKGRRRSGHIIHVDRLDDGVLRLYDPQVGKQIIGEENVLRYVNQFKYSITLAGRKFPFPPKLMRVDNLEFDTTVVDGILKETT